MLKIQKGAEFEKSFRRGQKTPQTELFGQDVVEAARRIIADVSSRGDEALYEYAVKYDGQDPRSYSIMASSEEIEEAAKDAGQEFCEAMDAAIANIRRYHEFQKENSWNMVTGGGSILGSRVRPLDRVAVYVPGGKAAYPSTVAMNVIPAQLAGVEDIYILTPPDREGKVNSYIAAAACLLGIKKIFKVGGAQAVAAAAYGTETVPKADKIVGPGNAYVAAAKREVFGAVDIDMLAGPSEIMIIADAGANAAWAAADLLAQAEHDEMACCMLMTDSEQLAGKIEDEIKKQLPGLKKRSIIEKSLAANGAIILADTMDEAVRLANLVAPEHLEIVVEEPYRVLEGIKHAGAIFIGPYSAEAIGDYIAGPNHVLPTAGTALFASPLSVSDFYKRSSFICYSREDFRMNAAKAACIARAEGLDAHANALEVRF